MSQFVHGQSTMHALHTPKKHTVPTHLQMPDQVLTLWSFSLTARQLLLLLVGVGIGGTIWQHLACLVTTLCLERSCGCCCHCRLSYWLSSSPGTNMQVDISRSGWWCWCATDCAGNATSGAAFASTSSSSIRSFQGEITQTWKREPA